MDGKTLTVGTPVTVALCDNKTVEGVVKGVYEDREGKITATVEYMAPTTNTFPADNLTAR
jgi:hypothetical protein